jgi:uncharacterized protein YdeI (YjbR/CyaY-like superfamily)
MRSQRASRGGAATDHVYVQDRAALHRWLDANHGRRDGIWLVYDKGGHRTLSYDDIVEEALAHGWIDSRSGSADDGRAKLWLAPRRARSAWSRRNKEIVERLGAKGQMHEAGLAVVAAAKESGTWSALDEVERLVEPDDLAAALDARPVARRHWDEFPRSTKRAILEWIASAKKPETRAVRIRTTVDEAAVNRRANQWRQPKSAGS